MSRRKSLIFFHINLKLERRRLREWRANMEKIQSKILENKHSSLLSLALLDLAEQGKSMLAYNGLVLQTNWVIIWRLRSPWHQNRTYHPLWEYTLIWIINKSSEKNNRAWILWKRLNTTPPEVSSSSWLVSPSCYKRNGTHKAQISSCSPVEDSNSP